MSKFTGHVLIEIIGYTCNVQTESVADKMAPTAAIIGSSKNQHISIISDEQQKFKLVIDHLGSLQYSRL